jgi:hypothetical protein
MIRIYWSMHAIERVGERFGFTDQLIPNEKILDKAKRFFANGEFEIKDDGIVYVCHKYGKKVLIKTVYKKGSKRDAAKTRRTKDWNV